MGPVTVDAAHITGARLLLPDGTHPAVEVELDRAGLDALNQLAAAQFEAGGKAAILVRGQITSVVPFQQPQYQVAQFEVSGLDLDHARQLVQDLGGDATVPPSTSTGPGSESSQCVTLPSDTANTLCYSTG